MENNTTHKLVTVGLFIDVIPDTDADTSYLDQPDFIPRKSAYENGVFDFVGVRVRIERRNSKTGVTQTTTTSGVWGIESDSGEEYFRSVAADEFAELKHTDNIDLVGEEGEKLDIVDAEINYQ